MTIPSPSTINDTIWITSRVRMIAERKALRNQNISYLAVTYYSVFSVILSIFESFYSVPYPELGKLNLASSVVVLVASLAAGGFRMEARAASFRECYLKLQKLYDEDLPDQDKKLRYRDILLDFPNHSNHDYTDLLVNHMVLEGKELTNHGKPLKWTWFQFVSFFGRRILYWSIIAALFLVPVAFLVWPFLHGRG
ncbi:SLATT domain-containing protein [Rhizobium leguminosarum]|uniref:SLATT domain-containing protein n=1 Tax=Rhizobium leguminosarum TaxID=384 RepID=UPI0013F984DA|nr:SLATT domain-containing protein [Rhizobium leguminosarum]NEJ82435.1 SLATT domain-containing protein [Rhizobium leguminosarum]NKK77920.1 SLATT domain-containing protein [Rhizobium leguminosarum bv. viciae]NKL45587.1 SLATT domain-containing protein [Rhizobium leguminosarum bv. viciae]